MRISRAQVRPYSLELHRPYTTAIGTFHSRRGFVLRIVTDAGTVGWGDAAPLVGYTPDLPASVHERLQALEAQVVGMSLQDVVESVSGLVPTLPTVVAAVESAAAVAAADAGGVSLATYLTSETPLPAIAVHALVTDASPFDVATAGRSAVADGYEACKLKVGGRPAAEDIDRIRELREAVGPAIRLRLDANGGWELDQGLVVLEAAATFGVEYVEDPVADWDTMAALRERVDVPLAVDRLFRTPDDVFAAEAVAAVAVVKPSVVGGPVRSLELAAAADRAGVRVVFGSLLDSAVGLTAAIHTAAAWGRSRAVSGLATGAMFATDVAAPPPVANGTVAVPSGPGLGITLTESTASEAASKQLPEGGPG
jgi:o-succinylbenzoate synthase